MRSFMWRVNCQLITYYMHEEPYIIMFASTLGCGCIFSWFVFLASLWSHTHRVIGLSLDYLCYERLKCWCVVLLVFGWLMDLSVWFSSSSFTKKFLSTSYIFSIPIFLVEVFDCLYFKLLTIPEYCPLVVWKEWSYQDKSLTFAEGRKKKRKKP